MKSKRVSDGKAFETKVISRNKDWLWSEFVPDRKKCCNVNLNGHWKWCLDNFLLSWAIQKKIEIVLKSFFCTTHTSF